MFALLLFLVVVVLACVLRFGVDVVVDFLGYELVCVWFMVIWVGVFVLVSGCGGVLF